MSSIHGVNVGGNLFDITDTSNIAPMNNGSFAVRNYAKDRFMIKEDGLLYRATVAISSGDPLVINGNIKRSNIDEVIANIETDSDLIAPTEDGTTASDDYSVGEQIARSGLLYEVIDAITAGDTFVVGNNIQLAGSVTEQIKKINKHISGVSNENLILNPFFAINSRGQAQYDAIGFSVDRWKLHDNYPFVLDVTDDGITLTHADDTNASWLMQYMDVKLHENITKHLTGKKLTFSILLADGTLYTDTFVVPTITSESNVVSSVIVGDFEFRIMFRTSLMFVGIMSETANATIDVRGLKLEIGEESTILEDSCYSGAVELAKCKSAHADYIGDNDTYGPIAVGGFSNPNLLDNPFFTINQRGASSYSNGDEYTIDRWYKNDVNSIGVLNVNNNGVSYVRTASTSNPFFLWQKSENILPAGTYTLSIKYKATRNVNGKCNYRICATRNTISTNILAQLDLPAASDWNIESRTFTTNEALAIGMIIQDRGAVDGGAAINDEIDIACVKLEQGAVSTLANDTAPNYQQELAKCQRYYLRISSNSSTSDDSDISWGAIYNNLFCTSLPIPCTMRAKPTVTMGDVKVFFLIDSSKNRNVSSVTVQNYTANALKLVCSFSDTSGLTAGLAGALQVKRNSYIGFSADL